MFVDFGSAQVPLAPEPPYLRSTYHLKADNTYQVCHSPLPSGDHILILTLSGRGVIQGADLSATVCANESFFWSPGNLPFQYYTLGDNWTFWWFEFYGGATLPEGKHPLVLDSLAELLCDACLNALKQGHFSNASALFGALLARLQLQYGHNQRSSYREELYSQAQQIIRRKLNTATVGWVADTVGISPRTLRDLFLECAGCSPKQYIMRTKLDTACYLLESTSKTIAEIAEMLGFSSAFHFSRTFREYKGIPPSAWRTKLKS